MSKLKYFIILVFSIIMFNINCPSINATSQIQLETDSVELKIGNTYQINFINKDEFEFITYKSSLEEVCTVDQLGLIEAINVGSAIIEINADTETTYFYVAIYQDATEINLIEESVTLEVGEHYQIQAIHNGSKPLSYKSENLDIASVSEIGMVTALKDGQTVIILSSGDLKKEFLVNVYTKIKSIEFEQDNFTLKSSESAKIVITTSLNGHSVNYQSNNENVCVVSSDGVIKAKKDGTAIILVEVDDLIGYIYVTVDSSIPVEKIELETYNVKLEIGETYKIIYKLTPIHTTDKIRFIIDDSNIANVSSDGIITALNEGEASIEIIIGSCMTVLNVSVIPAKNNSNYLYLGISILGICIVSTAVVGIIFSKKRKKMK